MILHRYTHYRGSQLHYAKTGNGEKYLLVFHGFGQDLRAFDRLAHTLAQQYTFYIFDLYFHGQSRWAHGEQPLEKNEWKETLEAFFRQEDLTASISLAGFSLGGKFVLATMESFPQRVKEIFLIAPDGIRQNPWYALATYPAITRNLFRSMILHPQHFLALTVFFERTGLVPTDVIRFAEHKMSSQEKRDRVYHSWVVFRHLTFSTEKITRLINAHSIDVTLIVGRFDKVIRPKKLKHFVSKLHRCRFEILESGHGGLIDRSLPYFTR